MGNFYAHFEAYILKDIRLSNPIGCSFFQNVVPVLGGTGGDSLYCIITQNSSEMPRTGSYRVKPNNSTLTTALPADEKAVLVSIRNNQVVTTSIHVAEYFGKEHSKVLRAIRMLDCSIDFNQANFGLVTYKDAKGEQRPMYYLTRDGFTFLAM